MGTGMARMISTRVMRGDWRFMESAWSGCSRVEVDCTNWWTGALVLLEWSGWSDRIYKCDTLKRSSIMVGYRSPGENARLILDGIS